LRLGVIHSIGPPSFVHFTKTEYYYEIRSISFQTNNMRMESMGKNKLSLKERLEKDVLLVAEGYIFELERRGYIKAGPFVPEVVLEHPDAVKQLHREFVRAGSDVVVACTYYGHRSKLKSIGKEDRLEALNHQAIQIAHETARDSGALVAGNLCNTWEYDLSDTDRSGAVVRAIFKEQVEWAVAGQVDFVIAETFGHLGEAMIALEAIKAANLPAVITFSPTTEQTCDGYTWPQACKALEDNGADVVGLNCGRGPQTMLPILAEIRQSVSGHVAALPVPYRTHEDQPCFFELRLAEEKNAFPVALDPFLLTRFEMADFALKAQNIGVEYIGICCGAGPHHVRAMAEAIGRTVPASVNSPEVNLHPIFGDAASQKRDFRECLYGLKIDD
jgi:betaine-homocysteine S-methyltransferase